MLFDDEFVLGLRSLDAQDAILKVITSFFTKGEVAIEGTSIDDAIETRDLLISLYTYYDEDIVKLFPKTDDHNELAIFFTDLLSKINTERSKNLSDLNKERFALLLGTQFHYSLSDADIQRIQVLINELRDLITSNTKLEDEHRTRLLRRLERLQGELHKRLSDLDRFYGLVGDAGVLVRKLGEDAKPIVDRIREIATIVWRSQADAEQLPSSSEPAFQIEERSDTPTE